APFGMPTVSRTVQPQLPGFLYTLSRSDGADPTRPADLSTSGDRNGEPFGEIGVVIQQDDAWQDQTGSPADPQPGNVGGGKRDVRIGAEASSGQGGGNLLLAADTAQADDAYTVIDAGALGPIANEAIRRLSIALGLTQEQARTLAGVELTVADLPGLALAQLRKADGIVVIDVDAAGHGWFVDATPEDDS
ncbi:MAG: hypothetical protein P8Y95_06280, partial [Gammaproteobacteria bacterium]